MDILSLLVIIPILTIIGIVFCQTQKQTRIIAAIGMSIQLLQSLYVVWAYLKERSLGNTAEMVFTRDYTWFETWNIHYAIGIDGISAAMIALTGVVIFTGIFASWNVKDLSKEFFISLILLSMGVFGFFISLDLFTMFLFYEIAVIPMYLLIGIWGSGKKEYSAMKLTLMLMGGSALLLVGLLGIYFHSAPGGGPLTFNILEISKIDIPVNVQLFLFPFTFIGFGVLGALFPFHTWSPDGHASAPTAVSMLHAGVLMKLGGYGCLRIATFLLPDAATELSTIFIFMTGTSVIYGALGAIMQTDLKYINAYSSVSHCGLVLFAVLMLNKTAFNGAVLQMLSHGLMTALFFALIGMIYGRTHTRDVYKMGGLMKILPFLSVCYVIAGLASLGLPGLSGFVAEMTIFVGAFQNESLFHRIFTILAISSIVVTAVYILRVVGLLLLGPVKNKEYLSLKDAEWHEKLTGVVLIIAIAIIGMAPLWLSDMIMDSLEPIMQKLTSIK
ncbi:MAG: NADH-quinone oxidoreductase subunit M [Bacteroidetes bacterium]|nr:NADH-quinone oxidoreductase subunit M [Bacteroidota bacterium]MBV6460372.1 NAD(P)H-quinone oxidoreductase chain 4 1 [Flavobacteriales bacterium]WKZ74740.1 MAG: NADH-quinone oxidoreductase subunit M [Vicingaceae bacterium]MCL4815760.1 NADH-quinone oxidoreductase subunit M [Flavobacteriales bacterium]NOG95794.1 NADH-quinone oxidoreductase subunit M [Bacteroidota bacterium]